MTGAEPARKEPSDEDGQARPGAAFARAQEGMFEAALHDDPRRLLEAIQAGADPMERAGQSDCHARQRCQGMTALMAAVREGSLKAMAMLLPLSDARAASTLDSAQLKSGVQAFGYTALMLAAHQGFKRGVDLLLTSSDPDARNGRGMTAADMARRKGHEGLSRAIEEWSAAAKEARQIEAALPAPEGAAPGRRSAL